MVENVWQVGEFQRVTTERNRPRVGFKDLDEALRSLHAAKTLHEQLKQIAVAITTVSDWLSRYAERHKNRPATPMRRRMKGQVTQLEQQLGTAQTQLKQQAQQAFEEQATKLSSKRNDASSVRLKGSLGQDGAYPTILHFVKALEKAEAGSEFKTLLTATKRAHYDWLYSSAVIAKLRAKLTKQDMGWFSLFLIEALLVPPDGSTVAEARCDFPVKVKQETLRCLSPMISNLDVALNLLIKKLRIVVVPRTKYLTELPMFAHLKDVIVRGGGRVWNDTRGVGGVKADSSIYMACTEENLLGRDLDGRLKRMYPEKTPACPVNHDLDHGSSRAYYTVKDYGASPILYDEGYSTTVHEFGHIVHIYGLSDDDRKLIEREYKRWRRGLAKEDMADRVWKMPTLSQSESSNRDQLHRDIALSAIKRLLRKNKRTQSEDAELSELMMRHIFDRKPPKPVKQSLNMGWEWVDGPIGLTDSEIERRKKDETSRGQRQRTLQSVQLPEQVTILGKKKTIRVSETPELPAFLASVPVKGSPRCYASSHVEEYFAQLTCCWFEANGGNDTYTKLAHKNKQSFVLENEPRAIAELLERVYGTTTIPNTNPRSAPL